MAQALEFGKSPMGVHLNEALLIGRTVRDRVTILGTGSFYRACVKRLSLRWGLIGREIGC